MRYCWAPNCKEADNKKTDVSFHAFPKDLRQRQLWIQATGQSCEPGRAAVICSKHFRLDDFERTSKHARLKRDVVPSQFNDAADRKEYEQQIQGSESWSGHPIRISSIAEAAYDSDDFEKFLPPENLPPENLSSPNDSEAEELTRDSGKLIWHPVHVKQVTSQHSCSPMKRAKYSSQAMNEIEALKKKVKLLQEDERRMSKKISTLSGMMKHLEDKQLLTENASDIMDMDKGGENLSDQELDENFEERFDLDSESVRTTLKGILQQNKDIQQQNRDILLENQSLKQQIQNLLEEQKRCLGEFGQRSVGEEITVQLYEPLEGFPLETIKQFEEMDSESKRSLRKKLYVHLCNLGGSRVREFLNSALKQIMTDKLVNSFTWPGCKNSARFGDTKIANVLYLAAKKCPLFRGPETKAEFKTEMLEVFRSTKQRFRNSLKKSLATEKGDEDQDPLLTKIERWSRP